MAWCHLILDIAAFLPKWMNPISVVSLVADQFCTPCTESKRDVCCLIARHALYRKGFIPNERKEPDHLMRSVEKLAKKRGRFFAYLPTQTIQISINSYLSENELAKVGCNFVASTSLLLRLHKWLSYIWIKLYSRGSILSQVTIWLSPSLNAVPTGWPICFGKEIFWHQSWSYA